MMLPTALFLLPFLPLALAAPSCSTPESPTSTSSVPASAPTTGPPTPPGSGSGIQMGWFADWHSDFGVNNISWSDYTHMAFFTAQPAPDGTVEVIVTDPKMVDNFTQAAKANNVKPILTCGGWSGSNYWSSSVATADNRTKLATSLVNYVNEHGFTGIDLDWEYPGKAGIGCNTKSPQDSANYLLFMQELSKMAPNLTLSAAVSIETWVDSTGQPMANVSAYSEVLDWIEIMNYDIYGEFSSVTGPNAPLNDTCAPASDRQGSAVSAVTAWTKAGFPANKIVLGVASYGHAFNVPNDAISYYNTINIYTPFNNTNVPEGDSWDPASTASDICGNRAPGNGSSGIFNFWGVIDAGFLKEDGTPAPSMVYLFDECSQTPFIYDPHTSVLVSYDDAKSFAAKGKYIKDEGLAGFAVYQVGGDSKKILLDAIVEAMAE